MTYTMGSLFAGIGGFDLGFERAGFKTLWQVEIDSYCQKVLAKNFPEAERFGDIKLCGIHNLRPVDVICGGFPCQDISNAGKRAGIEGERSGLWSEMHRVIRELRPKFVLVENVAALLGRGMGRVLGDLAEIGYDAEWQVVSAADVGAPHLRERVWIMAHPNSYRCNDDGQRKEGSQRAACGAAITPSQQWQDSLGASQLAHAQSEHGKRGGYSRHRRLGLTDCCEDVADPISNGCEGKRSGAETARQNGTSEGSSLAGRGDEAATSNTDNSTPARQREYGREIHGEPEAERLDFGGGKGWWAIEPSMGRVAHGVPKRVDRLRGLGNAVVPHIPEMFAHRIRQALEAA